MKRFITLSTIALLITSCATSNYGKIKYSRITSQKRTEVKQFVVKEQVILAETTPVDLLDTINTIEITNKEEKKVHPEKEKAFTTLREKLQITNAAQLTEITTIQNQQNDTIINEKEKDYNKFADSAIIFGGLSFIPVIGWIFSILAIIMGVVGIHLYKQYPDKYRGTKKRAVVGIILGICTIIAGIIITVLIFASL